MTTSRSYADASRKEPARQPDWPIPRRYVHLIACPQCRRKAMQSASSSPSEGGVGPR